MTAPKNVVVTGGVGRLGRFVVAELKKHGHNVTVLDMKEPQDGSRFIRADIMDIASLRKAFEGADAVAHLAGYDVDFGYASEEYIRVNVSGTWTVLQVAGELGIRKVVLSSSIAACGLQDARPDHRPIYLPVDEKQPDMPRAPYSVSKKLVEELALRVAQAGKIDVIVMRPMMVLQQANVAKLVERAKDPKDRWLFYYVTPEDAALAYRGALEKEGMSFGIFFVGARDSCSSVPTLELAQRLWPGEIPIRKPEVYAANPFASIFDSSAAEKAFGYRPVSDWTRIAGITR
jgi:nucleoside-diphosphate-sugar epimerase